MKIVVSIPAYNEEKTLGAVLDSIHKELKHKRYNYKVLVVDDGSTDSTAEIAKQHGATVVSHAKNRGLAEAFRTEMKKCIEMGADIIVHTDADGQYLASEIPSLVEKVIGGYDLVLGSRFKGKIESMPFIKRMGNKAFSRVLSNITKTKISDGQTGFRAFTREFAEKVQITSFHTYTQEQVLRAVKENYRITEVPIHFVKRGGGTKSRLMSGPFDYALKAWINILRVYRDYEPLRFFGYLGGFLLLAGIMLGAYIFYLIMTTGSAGGIPRVILSALLVLTGIQIIIFGFLADMFRK